MAGLISRHCSKNAWCRREGKDWPNILELNTYHNSFAGKHRAARWKFSKSEDAGHATRRAWNQDIVEGRSDHNFPRSFSAADHLGPGEYRVHRHFPQSEGEFRHWASRGHSFSSEPRIAKDGSLKGNSTTANNVLPNPLGPGQYPTPEMNAVKHKPTRQTFSTALEAQEHLRLRKSHQNKAGPGYYEAINSPAFEEASKRWDETPKRKHRGSDWDKQFSHIFSTVMPEKLRLRSMHSASAGALAATT